ncbi:MAG: hypothetical protein WBE76_03690 [Terracidiphilus sp.]
MDDAFEELLSFSMNVGQAQAQSEFTAPGGKRMVIEFVTAILTVPAGQSVAVTFFVRTGGIPNPGIRHALAVTPQGTFNGGEVYVCSRLVRLYPDPGTNVIFEVTRNSTSSVASGNISLTGYLR